MDKITLIKKWLDAGGSRRKWTVALISLSILATAVLFISTGSTPAPQYGALEPTPLYFIGIIAKLIAVLLLIIGAAVLLRRWQVKNGLGRFNGKLSVVETVRLSPKQAVHLVRVGNQHVLIGATDTTISMLTAVDLPETSVQPANAVQEREAGEDQTAPEAAQMSFTQLLQTLTTNQPAGSSRASSESKE
jgi:flagellar biosynthetic protein FliO